MNTSNVCLLDAVALASDVCKKKLSTTETVRAVLDRMEKLEADIHAFCTRKPDIKRGQAKAAEKATDMEDVTQEYHDKPMPLEACLGFKEPVLVWSGFGIAYIGAMIAGLIQQGRPLPLVLDALCRLLEASAEGCSACVLLFDHTLSRVQYVVAPGLPSSYNESLEGRPVSGAAGPCGLAASLKTQVVVSDVASDTRWESNGWPALALSHGLKSCWCSPILSSAGELLGTFTIYQREAGGPTPFDQALIEQFTHIASTAIERTRSEEALKRSEALLAKAQRLSSTGSFSWRVTTDEIAWSEEIYRIFEFDRAVPVTLELIGTRVHPEDVPLFDEMIERARRDGRDLDYEHRLQMPDQAVKYLHVVAHGTRDEDGQLEYIGAVQDVTQRRLSEEAVGKLQSELAHVARVTTLGALTASIAHEVNQPLSAIITNAGTCLQMLASDPPDIEGARETAQLTIRDGKRACAVITRLRALFRKKDATLELVDLNEITREVIALSLRELQRRRVVLRTKLADDLPSVTGDRVQLQQVILNLLLNAADAMRSVEDRPRHLLIGTTRDEGNRVRLTVQDTGIGLKPQDTDRLFDAFYTTKSEGMGLGLSVSRSIIESHQGRLWATPNEGPGATFSFSVPSTPAATCSDRPRAIQTPAVARATSGS